MIGTSLGPYKIIEQLGAGGMGEVYLAEDTRLGRQVAIKVLPAQFAADPERLARFEQEARAAAALNHPHIAAVFDVGSEPGAAGGGEIHYIVQEFLEGESLREPLKKGALPLKKALNLAAELAEALTAAHDSSIVHRDLKPENVFVTKEGHAKVLDFGLAKLTEVAGASASELSMSPTVLGTVAGQVMGTAGYMAPEQAAGSAEIDHRADVFAFGCVLYEMVTGRQPFAGRSVAETLSRIQHDEPPPVAEIDSLAPFELERIIKKCLAKDPAQRYQTSNDLSVDLRSLATDIESGRVRVVAAAGADDRRWARVITAAAVTAAFLAGFSLAVIYWGETGEQSGPASVSRLAIPLPEHAINTYLFNNYVNTMVAISPDGSLVAFVGGSTGDQLLYLRPLEALEIRPIPGSERAHNPFFSPDGQWVCFFTETGELKKVSVAEGSEPITLVRDFGNSQWGFGSWGDNGRIIFSTFDTGLFEVSAEDGGSPSPVTEPVGEAHQTPQILPGSRAVLFYAEASETVEVQALRLDAPDATPQVLVRDASHAFYLETGHLLYVQDGRLLARPFDVDELAFTGAAFSVPLSVAFDSSLQTNDPTPQIAISRNGTLVYAPTTSDYGRQTELVWVDRKGNETPLDTLDVWRPSFQLSPDETRLALEYRVGSEVVLSTYDLERRIPESTLTTMRKVTVGYAVWRPGSAEIVLSHPGINRSTISTISTDGSGREAQLFEQDASWMFPFNFSDDGMRLAYNYYRNDTGGDIGVYEFGQNGAEGKHVEFRATAKHEDTPRFSPDGRWIAYVDHSDDRTEIYVGAYPSGESARVTPDGGRSPLWSPEGSELFFMRDYLVDRDAGSGRGTEMWVVAIDTDPSLEIGQPEMLFSGPLYMSGGDAGYSFDVSNDGQRFLMARLDKSDLEITELVVVLNWFEQLRQLDPGGR